LDIYCILMAVPQSLFKHTNKNSYFIMYYLLVSLLLNFVVARPIHAYLLLTYPRFSYAF
jgi:hypothetical protein